jgi:protoporphyrinogen oxidase
MVSGAPVFEANKYPGGICSSYYLCPESRERFLAPPTGRDSYRFEHGGGHWIFGGDPAVLRFIEDLSPCQRYTRDSAVYFARKRLFVPYPVQRHLDWLPSDLARRSVEEIEQGTDEPIVTMEDWLHSSFGRTLVRAFFGPFHERYTAGLWKSIAPQDSQKSPSSRRIDHADPRTAGYNVTYLYPKDGLNHLVQEMASRADVYYSKRVTAIDAEAHLICFADGTETRYGRLISTLPLCTMQDLVGLPTSEGPDPHTSVLVINVGASRGARCPDQHWLYVPDSETGFHRVGFYSNITADSVPGNARDRVSLYIETAYRGGVRPSPQAVEALCSRTVEELTEWEFIREAEVVDPTWIDVAYTWSRPKSTWSSKLLELLKARDIFMVGRYGRWAFQGIADSIRDGFVAGGSLSTGD